MLLALYWTFHAWRRSIISVTPVARGIFGGGRGWVLIFLALYWTFNVARINHANHFSWQVRDDDFMVRLSSDHGRIILGLSSSRLSVGGSSSKIFGSNLEFKISWQAHYLVMLEAEGDCCCSAHCTGWLMYVWRRSIMRVIFRWGAIFLWCWNDSCCSAHCTGRLMCDKDQSWERFFVAGGNISRCWRIGRTVPWCWRL